MLWVLKKVCILFLHVTLIKYMCKDKSQLAPPSANRQTV